MVDYIIHNIKITFIVLLTIAIIFGNCLVIISVIFSEKLRRSCSQLTVRLITSLAVADLLVGICVLPFSIGVQLNNGYWFFGKALCQLWLAIDVWLCTASIYNLLAISLDRFIAITEPLRYAALMTPHRGRCLIAFAWIASLILSTPPVVYNWPTTTANSSNQTELYRCTPLNNDVTYILISANASFFGPMIMLIYFYGRIYCEILRSANFKFDDGVKANFEMQPYNKKVSPPARKSSSSSSRLGIELRAVKIVCVVTGVFLLSWLGFSVVYMLRAFDFCHPNCVSPILFNIFVWMGYANSAVNPLIYAVMNSEFRSAFRQIICQGCVSF